MAEVIQMPRLSDTMEEGNIVAWHKKEGDAKDPFSHRLHCEPNAIPAQLTRINIGEDLRTTTKVAGYRSVLAPPPACFVIGK